MTLKQIPVKILLLGGSLLAITIGMLVSTVVVPPPSPEDESIARKVAGVGIGVLGLGNLLWLYAEMIAFGVKTKAGKKRTTPLTPPSHSEILAILVVAIGVLLISVSGLIAIVFVLPLISPSWVQPVILLSAIVCSVTVWFFALNEFEKVWTRRCESILAEESL